VVSEQSEDRLTAIEDLSRALTWDEPTRVITTTSQLSMRPGAAFTPTLPAVSVTAPTFTW